MNLKIECWLTARRKSLGNGDEDGYLERAHDISRLGRHASDKCQMSPFDSLPDGCKKIRQSLHSRALHKNTR